MWISLPMVARTCVPLCINEEGSNSTLPPKSVRGVGTAAPQIPCYDTLVPRPTTTIASSLSSKATTKPTVSLHLVTYQELERDIIEGASVWALVVTVVSEQDQGPHPQEIMSLLAEFQDVFLEDLPNQLPPMRDI